MSDEIMRGTTPKHTFLTKIDLTSAVVLYITYNQNDNNIIEKTIEDVTIERDRVITRLTQEETLKVEDYGTVSMQIGARLSDGSVWRSRIMSASPEKILKDEVI